MTNGKTVLLASWDPGAECCFLGLALERSDASDSPLGSCFSEHKGGRCFLFLATQILMWRGEREGMCGSESEKSVEAAV